MATRNDVRDHGKTRGDVLEKLLGINTQRRTHDIWNEHTTKNSPVYVRRHWFASVV